MNGRLLALSLMIALPVPVFAAAGDGFVEKEFTRLDADHDGRLSTDEAKVYAAVLSGAETGLSRTLG